MLKQYIAGKNEGLQKNWKCRTGMTRNYKFAKTFTNNNAIQLAAQYGKCK